jgi:hypothetical protein
MRTSPARGGLLAAVLALAVLATPASAQVFSEAGDKEAGLAFSGQSFNDPFLRYMVTPKIGVQGSLNYNRQTTEVAGEDVTNTQLAFTAGMMYTLCATRKARGYVLPTVSYGRQTVADLEDDYWGAGLAVGGDVRITRNFLAGVQGGVSYTSSGGTPGSSGSTFRLGGVNAVNLTYRFPHRDPERTPRAE